MPDEAPISTEPHGNPAAGDELRLEILKLEYTYLTQSSFQTDQLRNQFVQFYLVLVGVAATALVGLAGLQARSDAATTLVIAAPPWIYSLIALFLGSIGVVMLPLFARLRRVVLECLQGTVLLKRYVQRELGPAAGPLFGSAMIWDATSLPTDERYLTASFVILFVFMLLDSSMFVLAALLYLLPSAEPLGAVLWSTAVGSAVLTLQVVGYRIRLWAELCDAMTRNHVIDKWAALGIADAPAQPRLARPLALALAIGGATTVVLVWLAWRAYH